MSKMTVIQLLNKIANGEIPKKIMYDDKQWIYDEKLEDYITYDDSRIDWKYTVMEYINDEVEILEEEKKIPEKLNYIHPDIQCSYNESELLLRIEANKDKINSIIDYLKSKGE